MNIINFVLHMIGKMLPRCLNIFSLRGHKHILFPEQSEHRLAADICEFEGSRSSSRALKQRLNVVREDFIIIKKAMEF